MVFGFFTDNIDVAGNILSSIKSPSYDLIYPEFNANLMVQKLDHLLNFAWNKIFRRSFLVNNDLRYKVGLSLIEDLEFASRAFPFANKVVFSSKIKYHYMNRQRLTLSKCFDNEMLKRCIMSIDLKLKLMHEIGVDPVFINKKNKSYSFNTLKFYISSLVLYSNNLTYDDILQRINEIFKSDSLIVNAIEYVPVNIEEKAFKFLIMFKCKRLLYLRYQIYKLKRFL